METINMDKVIIENLFRILYDEDKITKKELNKIMKEFQCTVI